MQLEELALAPSTEKVSKALKSSFKGSVLETMRSVQIHEHGIPILCSHSLLRRYGCGQIDLAIFRNGTLFIYEVKNTPSLISKKQFSRLNYSASFLSQIFSKPIKLHVIN